MQVRILSFLSRNPPLHCTHYADLNLITYKLKKTCRRKFLQNGLVINKKGIAGFCYLFISSLASSMLSFLIVFSFLLWREQLCSREDNLSKRYCLICLIHLRGINALLQCASCLFSPFSTKLKNEFSEMNASPNK